MRRLTVACMANDRQALRGVLHPGVVLISDAAEPALHESGAAGVAGRMIDVLHPPPGTSVSERSVNGSTGLILTSGVQVVTVICFAVRRGRVHTIWIIVRAEHLADFNHAVQ